MSSAFAPESASTTSQNPASVARMSDRFISSSSTTSTVGRNSKSAPAAVDQVRFRQQERGILVARQRSQVGEVALHVVQEVHLPPERRDQPAVLLLELDGLEGEIHRHPDHGVV